ncbi:MAG: hypothetical protein AB7G38_08470 [Dehalococcoidia bacterium]
MTTKEAMIEVIKQLPEDASVEDAIEKLYFLRSLERGLDQIRQGKTVSNEEVMKRIEKWLS